MERVQRRSAIRPPILIVSGLATRGHTMTTDRFDINELLDYAQGLDYSGITEEGELVAEDMFYDGYDYRQIVTYLEVHGFIIE